MTAQIRQNRKTLSTSVFAGEIVAMMVQGSTADSIAPAASLDITWNQALSTGSGQTVFSFSNTAPTSLTMDLGSTGGLVFLSATHVVHGPTDTAHTARMEIRPPAGGAPHGAYDERVYRADGGDVYLRCVTIASFAPGVTALSLRMTNNASAGDMLWAGDAVMLAVVLAFSSQYWF